MEVAPDDPLRELKLRLLRELGAGAGGGPALMGLPSAAAALAAARALVLRSDEAEAWGPDAATLAASALSSRNEAAALSLLWAHAEVLGNPGDPKLAELAALSAGFSSRTGGSAPRLTQAPEASGSSSSSGGSGNSGGGSGAGTAAAAAVRAWAEARGAVARLAPAAFQGGLRGLTAEVPLAAGETALSLPAGLLVTYATANESDLGKALQRIPGMGEEAIAVVWTMVRGQRQCGGILPAACLLASCLRDGGRAERRACRSAPHLPARLCA
jgi:hypothetical protein